jgi:hypothetical protein
VRKLRISIETWCVIVLSLIYWNCAGVRAAYRPLWFDEIFTWHISRLPSLGAIWATLHAGVDQNLPLTHVSVRAAHAVFGYSSFATRLPALIGFWIMLLCVYTFIKRRLPAPYALAGMTFPALTFAWYYATEARAYGMLLGFGALALVAWQNAAEGRRRTIFVPVLGICLAASLACHYTGALLAVPFALGEVVRTINRRRVDVPIWCAFAFAIPVAAIYPTLAASTRDWDLTGLAPTISTFPMFYSSALRAAVTPALISLFAVVLFRRSPPETTKLPVFPRHESAALAGFAVIPVCFIGGGMLSRHSLFYERYGVLSVIGLAAFFAWLLYRVGGGSRRGGMAAALALAAWFTMARGMEARHMARPVAEQLSDDNSVLEEALAGGVPVVVPDPLTSVQEAFYLPADRAGRLYFVFDLKTGRRFKSQDLVNQLMVRAAKHLPLKVHVEPWRDFSARNPRFLVLVNGSYQDWLFDTLQHGSWRVTLKRQNGGEWLFEVNSISDAPRQ